MRRDFLIVAAACLLAMPCWSQSSSVATPGDRASRVTVEGSQGVVVGHLTPANSIDRTLTDAVDPSAILYGRRAKNVPVYVSSDSLKPATKAPLPDPNLSFWGVVGYSDHNEAGTMNAHRGFYSIDGVGNFKKLDAYPISNSPSKPAAFLEDSTVLMTASNAYDLYSTKSWEKISTVSYPSRDYSLYSVTWDPFTQSLLACTSNISSTQTEYPYQLCYIDPTSMRRSVIADLEIPLYAITIDEGGRIYLLDQSFNFSKCSRSGEITLIKSTIVPFVLDKAFGGGSMAWDKNSKRILVGIRGVTDEPMASAEPFPGCIYWVDPATGDAEMIVQFTYNDELTGIAFTDGLFKAAAPAAVSDLECTFSNGSMEGSVSFTAPKLAIDGSELSGELTWRIFTDGIEIATGTCAPGSEISKEVTSSKGGQQVIAVQFSNAAGDGKVVGKTEFIGTDVPNTPGWFNATYSSGGLMKLTWGAVTTSVNGGYINPEEITYKVVRYNNSDPESEPEDWCETTGTSYFQPMTEPTSLIDYQFGITATYDGKTSPEGKSNVVRAGSFVAPYSYDFPDADEFKKLFTLINYNTESYSGDWEYNYDGWGVNKNGFARCRRGYGASGDVDKWLITPGFKFEKDKVYRFDIDVKSYGNSYNEQIEVLVGTDPLSPELWDTYVIDPTDFAGTTWRTLTGYISVPSSDKYYIGIHGCTPGSRSHYYIFADNIKIGQAVNATAPGAVTALDVAAGPLGTHYVDLSFKSPTKNFMETEDLKSLTSINVYRNDELLKSYEAPVLGSDFTFKDEDLKPGQYTYRVVTVNEEGEGPAMTQTVYVGAKLPARPNNVAFTESETTPGEVTITWDPVTTDVDGGTLPEEFVSYNVVDLVYGQQIYLKTVQGTSYTYQAVDADAAQEFKCYAIFAETESGIGYGLGSMTKPVGKPSSLPYRESFADAGVKNPIALETSAWGTVVDGDIENGPVAVDGDNGYAVMIATFADETSELVTGKIDLTEAKNPYLTFWTYNIVVNAGVPDQNEYRIVAECEGESEALKSFAIAQECRHEGWNRILVDLSKYSGKVVQLHFRAKAVNFQFTLLDDVRIFDAPDHDLAVKHFITPEEVNTEANVPVRVVIENYGATTENNYTIDVLRDGQTVVSVPGKAVSAAQTVFVDLADMMTVMDAPGEHTYSAVINLDDDAEIADNTSAENVVVLRHPKYELVGDLAAEQLDTNIELTWNAPKIDREPAPVTYDFEDLDVESQYLDEWNMLDEDGLPIWGFSDLVLPGLAAGAPQAWFLLDNSHPDMAITDSFYAHSGEKCLAQLLPEDGACDDYLISPRMYPVAQEVDFYARNYYPNDNCEFEFLFSVKEANPVFGFNTYQFYPLARVNVYSHEWTHYTFEVPAGTTHVAIRANTNSGMMLMVDDVTFRPLGNSHLQLVGYNVYHNGEKLTETPIKSRRFLHEGQEIGSTHEYAVTAVYEQGESKPATVNMTLSGVENEFAAKATILTEGLDIIVLNAEGKNISIADINGVAIYGGEGAERTAVTMPAHGVYLVKIGNKTYKTIL